MDNIVDDLIRAARRCERVDRVFEEEPLASLWRRVMEASDSVGEAWSGSWIGYQAGVYTRGLRPCRPGEHFDQEWGGKALFSDQTTGEWCEYKYEAVCGEIMRRAGEPTLDPIADAAEQARTAFEECKADLVPTFDAVLATSEDAVLRELRQNIADLKSHDSRSDFIEACRPTKVGTRDARASQGGIQAPHHVSFKAALLEQRSHGLGAAKLGQLAKQAATYLQKKAKMKGRTVAKTEGPVFIGHGHSPVWRELKDFLVERLSLDYEEYNREPTPGLSTKERLLEMLDRCCFAFVVMTAEGEHADETKHARENVIHEAGLFQGRYGFERAIVL